MPTNLGARPLHAPLPTGVPFRKPGAGSTGPAWPGAENFLYPGDGSGGDTRVFNRSERFWLRAGACTIVAGPGWTRYDYQLRLVVNGSYGNDLNGINFFQKANVAGGLGGNGWWGISIEGLFYCEKNTDYIVYFLSKGGGASCAYYQASVHYYLWAYTIGEGVY